MNRLTFTVLTGAVVGLLVTKSFAAKPPRGIQRIAMVMYPEMTALAAALYIFPNDLIVA